MNPYEKQFNSSYESTSTAQGFLNQASNTQFMGNLNARTESKEINSCQFQPLAYSHFPYYFQQKERQDYVIKQEENLMWKFMKYKQAQFITIKKVDYFTNLNVSQFWMVDSKTFQIICHHKAVPTLLQLQGIISKYEQEKTDTKYKSLDKLVFGRSMGMGRVVNFQNSDVSRQHFCIKPFRNQSQSLKQKISTLLCFKKTQKQSKWFGLPAELKEKILDYVCFNDQAVFQIQDMKSKAGTYLHLQNGYQLKAEERNEISLSAKGEIGLKVLKIINQTIQSEQQFAHYSKRIQNYIADFVPNEQDFPLIVRPIDWKNYNTTINSLNSIMKNQQNQVNDDKPRHEEVVLSTIFIEIRIVEQFRYIVLNNCKSSHQIGNGVGDISLMNPFCQKNKQMIRIYYENGRWKGESPESGLKMLLSKKEGVQIKGRTLVRLGKNKIVIDLPKYV